MDAGFIVRGFFLFILAFLFAFIEVQIEGKDGWGRHLPTWRARPGSFAARWYAHFMQGKELTGYHAGMFSLVFLVLLLPFVFGVPVTAAAIFQTFSLYFLLVVFWDFLWFVVNPYFGLSKFRREHIPWHKRWFWRLPADYYVGFFLSFGFAALSFFVTGIALFSWWFWHFGLFIVFTFLVSFFFTTAGKKK